MIVTLDGQRVNETFAPDTTLEDLIDRVRAAPPNKDRLIISVSINGQRLDDDELQNSLGLPLEADAQIDLESGDPVTLVTSALRALADNFAEAEQRLPEIADHLSAGDPDQAMRDVGDFVELWQITYRALAQSSGLLGRDLTASSQAGRGVQESVQELVLKLTELREALEARDMVLLADLVRHELPPMARSWSALLTELADEVASTQPASPVA